MKSLEPFVFERALTQTLPFESLRGARVGIDVSHYVSRLMGFKREALLDATGGFPLSLFQYIR